MATVNKTSIREEISRLKKDFDHLCNDGKVSAEIRVVMNSILMVVELILTVHFVANMSDELELIYEKHQQKERGFHMPKG